MISALYGTAVRCTCCNWGVKVGEIHVGTGLQMVGRTHGSNHVSDVSAKELLERLSGTVGHDGVARFVASIFNGR